MDSDLEVRPSDIKRLDHEFFLSNPRYLFYDLFGGIGYAKVVEVLLKESQERGE